LRSNDKKKGLSNDLTREISREEKFKRRSNCFNQLLEKFRIASLEVNRECVIGVN